MSVDKSWSKFYKVLSDHVAHGGAAEAIRKAVRLQRRVVDSDIECAFVAVADELRLTPRRVRSWYHGDIIQASIHECQMIRYRWWKARETEVERLRELARKLENELEKERIEQVQFELPLGITNGRSLNGLDRDTFNEMASVARELDAAARAEAKYRQHKKSSLKT